MKKFLLIVCLPLVAAVLEIEQPPSEFTDATPGFYGREPRQTLQQSEAASYFKDISPSFKEKSYEPRTTRSVYYPQQHTTKTPYYPTTRRPYYTTTRRPYYTKPPVSNHYDTQPAYNAAPTSHYNAAPSTRPAFYEYQQESTHATYAPPKKDYLHEFLENYRRKKEEYAKAVKQKYKAILDTYEAKKREFARLIEEKYGKHKKPVQSQSVYPPPAYSPYSNNLDSHVATKYAPVVHEYPEPGMTQYAMRPYREAQRCPPICNCVNCPGTPIWHAFCKEHCPSVAAKFEKAKSQQEIKYYPQSDLFEPTPTLVQEQAIRDFFGEDY